MNFLPQCFAAPDAEECLVWKLIKKGHGSFSRFAKQYARSHHETGGCTPMPYGDLQEVLLFPSKLPWIKPPVRSRGRRGHSSKQRWEAFVRMHWIWGLCNFLEGGSPCNHDAAQFVVDKASSGVWTKQHECYAKAMYLKILRFVSHPEGTLERGTAKLNDLISRIRLSFYDPKISFDEAFSSAMSVNPERISLPEQGGILDPGQHLTGKQLRQFKRMHKDIPHGLETGKEVKPCHKVEPKDWPILLKKLWDAQMISFVPIEDALCENGKLVKGGLFCVPHKPTSDRLINDRRPLNARESRLDWSKLPAGHMLCQLVLEKNESIRCSGDDLSNYFYLIKHSPLWLPRNRFGDPIGGEKIPWAKLDPKKKYLPSFKIVCVGDTNGVDIAQATHESILKAAGCLDPKHSLVYGEWFPASKTMEGLYIDDHLLFQIVNSRKNRNRGPLPDETLLEASRNKYRELNLPRSEKKAFEKSYDFKAWGTQISSVCGRIGTPIEKLRQIEGLTGALVLEGKGSKKALQKLVGLYVHPFMHRRELMSLFHHTYLYIEKLPEGSVVKLPTYVCDELVTAMIMLPLAEANVRSPISVQIAATDASSKMGGRASTLTTRSLAKLLYRCAESKGEHTRLDWDTHCLEVPSCMKRPPDALIDVMQKHTWVSTQSIKFLRKDHINILEMEMLKQEIKDRANSGRGNCRIINLCDSRVVVGAFGKGRSSSKNLNHKLRSIVPWLILGDIRVANLWVPTDKNPADYPSRNEAIPSPVFGGTDPLLKGDELAAVQVYRTPGVQQLLEREDRENASNPVMEHNEHFDIQEISNRTFLTDPPKSLKTGSRARARRFQLQKGLATARARANPKRGSV